MISTQDLGVVLTAVLFLCVYIPISAYYVRKLFRKTYRVMPEAFEIPSVVFLRQRYTSLSLIAGGAYTVQFASISGWIWVYTDWYHAAHFDTLLLVCSSSLQRITAQFVITLALTLRFWLISFRIKFQSRSSNHE